MLKLKTIKFLALFMVFLTAISFFIVQHSALPGEPTSLLDGYSILLLLSGLFFTDAGIPGLIYGNSWSDFGLTIFGWLFLSIFWLLVLWLFAWAAASLTSKVHKYSIEHPLDNSN
jgi:hypothetical protein